MFTKLFIFITRAKNSCKSAGFGAETYVFLSSRSGNAEDLEGTVLTPKILGHRGEYFFGDSLDGHFSQLHMGSILHPEKFLNLKNWNGRTFGESWRTVHFGLTKNLARF